jgi:hypothetical protein
MPKNIRCRDCANLFDGGLGLFCCANIPAWTGVQDEDQTPMTPAFADRTRTCEAFESNKKEPTNVQP